MFRNLFIENCGVFTGLGLNAIHKELNLVKSTFSTERIMYPK